MNIYISFTMIISMVLFLGCERKQNKCVSLQEKVDELNIKYYGELRGGWAKVPEAIRSEIASINKKERCDLKGIKIRPITDDGVWGASKFKLKEDTEEEIKARNKRWGRDPSNNE